MFMLPMMIHLNFLLVLGDQLFNYTGSSSILGGDFDFKLVMNTDLDKKGLSLYVLILEPVAGFLKL